MIRYGIGIIISLLVLGCSSGIEFVPKNLTLTNFDLTSYSKKGFLFTPYKYLGDYESIGIMSIIATPEAKLTDINTGKKDHFEQPIFEKMWKINDVPVAEAMDSLYAAAMKLGANAIVDLDLKEIDHSYNAEAGKAHPVTIYGYKIYGFAIKRLGTFKTDTISSQLMKDNYTNEGK
ncbi:MAG: hypothetical protein ABSE00_05860 [Chitinispirillaceae bacterium]|jgi:uncharacterized protein YbjQ (UPF0145 family)